jgi:hypothetical protein
MSSIDGESKLQRSPAWKGGGHGGGQDTLHLLSRSSEVKTLTLDYCTLAYNRIEHLLL